MALKGTAKKATNHELEQSKQTRTKQERTSKPQPANKQKIHSTLSTLRDPRHICQQLNMATVEEAPKTNTNNSRNRRRTSWSIYQARHE